MTQPIHLFAYGTLKPGEVNYRICAPYVTNAQPAIAMGQVYHLPLNYPALAIGAPGMVQGVLLSFDDAKILRILDEFEQHDPATFRQIYPGYSLELFQYSRKTITTFTPKQAPLKIAWGYVMELEQIRQLQGLLVPAGDWSHSGRS